MMRASLWIVAASASLLQAQTSLLSATQKMEAFKARNGLLLENTHDYACLETIARLHQAPGAKPVRDVVRVEVGFAGGKEIYGWQDSAHFSDQSLASMTGAGLVATGVYGEFAQGLMTTTDPHFQPAGEEELYEEAALRYDFLIPLKDGVWNLEHDGHAGQAGERGALWVDAKSLVLRRIDASPDQMPPKLGLKRVRMVIDYELATLSGKPMLLPMVARVALIEKDNSLNLSHMFFTHCRSFGAESSISFGAPADKPARAEDKITRLPEAVELSARLKTAIDLKHAAPGDAIEAVVLKSIAYKRRTIVEGGAAFEGNIRQVRLVKGGYAVTLEFDRVESVDGWAQVYGRLKELRGAASPIRYDDVPDVTEDQQLKDPEIPGVATLYLRKGQTEIPAGLLMKWKTENLTQPVRGSAGPVLGTGLPMN